MPLPQIRTYSKPASAYAEQYQISLSTAQRWQGLNAPFDNPERMSAWVAANTQKPPASFGTGEDDGEHADIDIDGLELGARAEIEALLTECAKARVDYQKAKVDNVKAAKWKHWQLMLEQLRKLQKDTPRSEKDDGKSVPIADVQDSITRALVGIRKELETLPQSLAMACSHLKPDVQIEIEKHAKLVVDEVVASMEKAKWTQE